MTGTTLLQRETPLFVHESTEPAWPRRALALAMAAIGASLVVVTFAANLFDVGPAFDRLTTGFRPTMTAEAVETHRADIEGLAAAGTEFQTSLAPTLAAQLKLTPAQMNATMSSQFPAVVAGLDALPTVVPEFEAVITTLDEQRALFRSADAIPTQDVPARTVPWSLAFAGFLAVALGAYVWFAPRAGARLAVALGVILVVVPVMLSLPQKAADADEMNGNLRPVYTQELITGATSGLATLSAMGTEMQTKMLPAFAAQLKMTPAQLRSFLAADFPATAAALESFPAATGRFEELVATFGEHLDDYDTLEPVELVPIVRLLIISGFALLLLGAAGLAVTRKR